MDEKLLKKYNRKWKKATLMDDLKFREIAKSKEAIEEILRVVLNDEKLVILEVIEQRNRNKAYFHGVILDCECQLKDKTIGNVEVQVSFKDNPQYRMRYNQSVLTVENSPKNRNFKYEKIPKIISIMFCEFDLFKQNKPIYEIYRKVNNTNIIADNGIREIYVNINAKTKNEKINQLFKIIKTVDYKNDKMFPNLSKRKEEVTNLEIGGKIMSGLTLEIYKDAKKEGIQQGIQQGMQKGKEEGKIAAFANMVKKKLITTIEAAKELGMSETEFKKLAMQV